ncbi:MAG: hypothetical protein C0501_10680 [Isosphaera sp.]|nr:hypothetical protein [Isosphaera sp.]
MSVSYTCPNPDCGVPLKTAARVATGKTVKCPKCGKPFVPEPAAAEVPAPIPEPAAAAAGGVKRPFADDDDESDESVKKGYGVVRETEEELKAAEKNKPKFVSPKDKFKKSARGPAQALLVMPANLLTAEGLLTLAAGIVIFVIGMWPLVFNDAPPGDEELEEALLTMVVGCCCFLWGGLVCWGASKMQELDSYPWAYVGSVMGCVPLLVGIYGIVMLQNPKVKAGFEESEGGPEDDEEGDEDGDDDDEEEDDEDGDEEDEDGDDMVTRAAKRAAKRAAGKIGRKLLGGLTGKGGDDEDGDGGEEEEEEEKPKKRRKKPADEDEE